MKKRYLLTLFLTILFASLYALPQTPAGRTFLLKRVQESLNANGYLLTYDQATGNPWGEVQLSNARLEGDGIDVTVESLNIAYALPGLARRTLPLSVEAAGVSGQLTLSQVLRGEARTLAIQPQLRNLTLERVALDISEFPYALPDLNLSDLQVTQVGGTLHVAGSLRTLEGSADMRAEIGLEPLLLDLTLLRADARLGRAYWDGLEGGELSGKVLWDGVEVSADLELRDGQALLIGIPLTGIYGDLRYRGDKLETQLAGEAFGGTVTADATVDVAAQQWQGDLHGTASLAHALPWLRTLSSLPDVGAAEGLADVYLRFWGWQEINVVGEAQGAGVLAERALEDLQVTFDYRSPIGTRVEAQSLWSGGAVGFRLEPQAGGFTLTASAQEVGVSDSLKSNGQLTLVSSMGSLEGGGTLEVNGLLLERQVQATTNATLNEGVWLLELAGSDSQETTLAGRARLTGEGLSGNFELQNVRLEGFEQPVTVTLSTDGLLESLPLTFAVTSDTALAPALAGYGLETDLRGSGSAVLQGTTLTDVQASLGALTLEGTWNLSGGGNLRYTLAPIPMQGVLEGIISVTDGSLVSGEDSFSGGGLVRLENIRNDTLTLPPLTLTTRFAQGETFHLSATDTAAGVRLELTDERLELALTGLPLNLLGEALTVRGTLEAPLAALEEARVDMQLEAEGARLGVTGTGETASVNLSLLPGFATLPTQETLELRGNLQLEAQTLALEGTLGAVPVALQASPERLELVLENSMRISVADPLTQRAVTLAGTMPLERLAQAFGYEVAGQLTADARWNSGIYGGNASFNGNYSGQDLAVTLQGTGESISGRVMMLGDRVSLEGLLYPLTDARVEIMDLGDFALRGSYPDLRLSGTGSYAGGSFSGVTLPPQPYEVQGSLEDAQVRLQLGSSSALLNWNEAGWGVTADLLQNARYEGVLNAPLHLEGRLTMGSLKPDGAFTGTLRVNEDTLQLDGSLNALNIDGTLSNTLMNDALELDEVTLEGNLVLAAVVNLLETSYRGTLAWVAANEQLSVNLEGQGTDFSARLSGTGIQASINGESVRLETSNFRLEPFVQLASLPSPTFNGTLAYNGMLWDGNLRATLPEGTVLILGEGATLSLSAALQRDTLELSADGQVYPTLALDIDSRLSDLLTLEGTLSGQVQALDFAGELRTTAYELPDVDFALAPQRANVRGSFQNGLQLELSNPTGNVQLVGDTLSGSLGIPFTLQNGAHTLQAVISGTLLEPRLTGTLAGETVQGNISLTPQGGQADLVAALELPELGASRTRGRFTFSGSSWTADIQTQAQYQGLPLLLEAQGSGDGTSYLGGGTLSVAGEVLPVTLEGEGADLTVTSNFANLDLAPFAPLLPLPVTGRASGGLRVVQDEAGLRVRSDVRAQGMVQGQAFNLTLGLQEEGGVALEATVGTASLSLNGSSGSDLYTVTLETLLDNTPLSLQAQARWAEGLQLSGSGRYGTEALSLSGTFTPERVGTLALELGDATLRGTLAAQGAGYSFGAALAAPSGLLTYAEPLNVALEGTLQEGAVWLERLEASSRYAGEALTVTATGNAWPAPNLRGSLLHAALPEALVVTLEAQDGWTVTARAGDLKGGLHLTPSLEPDRASLMGTLTLADYGNPSINSNLRWTLQEGFSGEASVSISPMPDGRTEVQLTGMGSLSGRGSIVHPALSTATFTLNLPPNPLIDTTLNGTAQLELDPTPFLGTLPADIIPPRVRATLELGGSLFEPTARGGLELTGSLTARGNLEGSLAGVRLTLAGEGLTAAAEADADGWNLSGSLRDYALESFLPLVREPQLSTDLYAAGTWGDRLTGRLENLLIRTLSSTVQGSASYDGMVRAMLEGTLELSDFDLPAELLGTMQGRLLLTDSELSGSFQGTGLRLEGQAPRFGSTLTLAGSPTAPVVEGQLYGEAEASGNLRVRLEPALSRYTLEGDMQVGTVNGTGLALSLVNDILSATGLVSVGDYVLRLSQGEGSSIGLTGERQLAGWQGVTDGRTLSLSGNLSSLEPNLSGTVQLSASLEGAIRGELGNVNLYGVRVGDVSLTADTFETVQLSGESLEATLSLAEDPSWAVSRLNLPLQDGVRLEASGAGSLTAGRLEATLTSNVWEERATLPLTVQYGADGISLNGTGSLFGGRLELASHYQESNGWGGRVSLIGASVQGADLDLEGNLRGLLTSPQLAGSLRLEGGENLLVTAFSASPDAVTLVGTLQGAQLEAPLPLQASLYPHLHLRLGEGEETLELAYAQTLTASGGLELDLGAVRLDLQAAGESLGFGLAFPAVPGLAFRGALPLASPVDVLSSGVTLVGTEATGGQVRLRLAEGVTADVSHLSYASPAGTLSLNGSVRYDGGAQGRLEGTWHGSGQEGASTTMVPWLAELNAWALNLTLEPERVLLTGTGANGSLEAQLDLQHLWLSLGADLQLEAGRLQAALRYTQEAGSSGYVYLQDVPFNLADTPLSLSGTVHVDATGLGGEGTLEFADNPFAVSGRLGWASILPPPLLAYLPGAGQEMQATLVLPRTSLGALPFISEQLPHLQGHGSGSLVYSEGRLGGSVSIPDLGVGTTLLPTQLELSGTLDAPILSGYMGRSYLELSLNENDLGGLLRLEGFPAELLVEAALGASEVTAQTTATVRFNLPLNAPQRLTLEAITEAFRLEREGVVTEGTLAFSYREGALTVERAAFGGAEGWSAQGRVTPEALDLQLSAHNADFTPLLELVPALAALDVRARGSLNLTSAGTLEAPRLQLSAPVLELSIAGVAYRLEGLDTRLEGGQLSGGASLQSFAPLAGRLSLGTQGQVTLLPLAARNLQVRFSGWADVPNAGRIEGLEGSIRADAEGVWGLEAGGRLGNPFSLRGSLSPLDLHLSGQALTLSAPQFFLAEGVANVDLRAQAQADSFSFSGEALITQGRLSFARNQEEAATGETVTSETAPAATVRNPLYERLLFDNLRLRAPQGLTFRENFGSADATLDLTLSGSAAQPLIQGEARTVRGNIRFSGQEFTLTQGVALFEASGGAYPFITAEAVTTYDKSRVLRGGTGLNFIEPRGGTFDLFLNLTGEFVPDESGRPTLQLTPTLLSNAVVQGNGVAPRPLEEPELLSLVTLGRLELNVGGLTERVAGTALDTALDVLFLGELQKVLGEALGVELFEIRTTAVSSLLEGGANNFGVSLRVGGYIEEDLFASFEVGNYDQEGRYALSNRFSFQYNLAPLELSFGGGLSFLNNPDFTPVTEVNFGIGYNLTQRLGVEAGLDFSGGRQSISLGVSYSW